MARKLNTQHQKIFRLTMLAILTALVVVLQLTGTAIKIPGGTSISLTLVPIVLGAMILGPVGGAWLGFLFGLIVYLMGVFGADAFTFILFTDHPLLTAMVCFGKGIAAGVVPALIYKALFKKDPAIATFVAAGAAPIVNTGLFILGALTMSDTLSANFVAEGSTVIYFLAIVCAGINFIFEFLLNMILSPALNIVMIEIGIVPRKKPTEGAKK